MDDDIGKMIFDYRVKHNISQLKFAELCEVSSQTVCNIENGKQKPKKLTAQRIKDFINKENA